MLIGLSGLLKYSYVTNPLLAWLHISISNVLYFFGISFSYSTYCNDYRYAGSDYVGLHCSSLASSVLDSCSVSLSESSDCSTSSSFSLLSSLSSCSSVISSLVYVSDSDSFSSYSGSSLSYSFKIPSPSLSLSSKSSPS